MNKRFVYTFFSSKNCAKKNIQRNHWSKSPQLGRYSEFCVEIVLGFLNRNFTKVQKVERLIIAHHNGVNLQMKISTHYQ